MDKSHFNQNDRVDEGKITIKRRYTENYPARTVGKSARIRNKMLEAISDGAITQEEFNSIIAELSSDSKRWISRNSKLFNITEAGITLTGLGKKILSQITVNEKTEKNPEIWVPGKFDKEVSKLDADELTLDNIKKLSKKHRVFLDDAIAYVEYSFDVDITENKENNMKTRLVFESFGDFVNSLNKNNEELNEGTRGQFGMIDKKGNIQSVYMHYDSYPENILPIIKKGYRNAKKVQAVIDRGDTSGLDKTVDTMDFYEDGRKPTSGKKAQMDRYIKKAADEGGAEYIYLYDESEKTWYMVDVYGDMQLVPAFESVVIDNELKENLNEGINPKIKKAMKAVEKGETVYGENIRFPGRFKIIEFSMGGAMALIDYEDGTKPYEMAAMNIAIDKLQFESVVNEAVNASGYIKAGKLGYNDQFLGRRSLSWTLSVDLGLKASDEFVGPWLGFDHVSLYAIGKKGGTILDDALTDKYTYDELKAAAADFLGIKESVDVELNEAFKSSKLRNLMNMDQASAYGKNKNLGSAFYGMSKVKLDKVGDESLVDVDPKTAYKQYANNKDFVVFYIVDNEKENPYSDEGGRYSLKPGILALSRAKDFLSVSYDQRRSKNSKNAKYTLGKDNGSAVGGNKNYKGYGATGISSIKRAAELADRAIVFNLVAGSPSSQDDIAARIEAKEGAIAFKSAKDFKDANRKRYQEILAAKAAALPLDKMVEDAINQLTAQMQAGIKSGEKTQYGEIKVGQNSKGRDVKVTDVANHMNSILRDYERYVSYIAQAEKEKEDGYSSGYYERESKNYAKSLKDGVKKIKKFDYAW